MKMLLISNMYPSESNPGFGVFVRNFKNSLSERGTNIDLAVIRGKAKSKTSKIKKYLAFFLKIYALIILRRYDVIYVHYVAHSLLPLIPILLIKKLNIIVNAHGEDLLPRSKLEKLIFRINRKAIENSLLIVVPSEYFKSIALSLFPSGKIFVSPSGGLDLDHFHPSAAAKENNSLTLGYVSRIDHGKGWDTFLNALHELKTRKPDVKINAIVAGTGSQLNEFHRKIRDLELCNTVSYLGPLNQGDLPKIYSQFDLFIFPTKLPESLGLVGLEALACGTPAICSSIGGINTYMQDGKNGYTFLPGDHSDLTSKIIKYMQLDSSQKNAMQNSARETTLKYDRNIVADLIFQKIQEAVNYEN